MSARDASVIVLGSVNTDLVIRGPRLPWPGETVLGGVFYQAAGGKGANQALAAARAGRSPVTFIAAIGDDPLGKAALQGFQGENLDTKHIRVVPGASSGVALILVDERGENCISVASGANALLRPEDVNALPDGCWPAGGVFLAVLESPLETVVQGLNRAKRAGLTTILNPAPADTEISRSEILQQVDILTPNEGEAALLTGMPVGDEASAVAAAKTLRQLGCGAVIVTRGAAGCVIVADTMTSLPAHAVQAIDTTAAGDAFNGALAAALAEGETLIAAARFASRAAAISVTRIGAQPSLPRREEIDGWR